MKAHRTRTGVLAALVVALMLAAATPATARDIPPYRLKSYKKVGGELSFKCDIAAALSAPPELVVFGGSRATRFRPSDFNRLAKLTALNAATQNFRPEDGWAISKYLFRRAPHVKLHAFFAVQATTFSDKRLAPGLVFDPRLSRWFPPRLVAQQQALIGTPGIQDILHNKRYSKRGLLLWNIYDQRRASGVALADIIAAELPFLVAKAGNITPVKRDRSHRYFEKTVRLFNAHGVTPVVVIMPYHPTALAAMLVAGWQAKEDALKAYLADLQTRCQLEVVDLIDIQTFGGSPDEFYDTTHVTMENSRRIIDYVVQNFPACFQ